MAATIQMHDEDVTAERMLADHAQLAALIDEVMPCLERDAFASARTRTVWTCDVMGRTLRLTVETHSVVSVQLDGAGDEAVVYTERELPHGAPVDRQIGVTMSLVTRTCADWVERARALQAAVAALKVVR